jgi:hypothetical protein
MLSRLTLLLFVPLFFLSGSSVFAQQTDYLKHGKIFNLCSYKRDCSNCHGCGKQRYIVKLKNNLNKDIKSVSFVFYSDVFNKVLTKDAKIQGDVIKALGVGQLYVCIPEGEHWAISQIIYEDDSANNFVVNERLRYFIQEPDECDCTDNSL